nr:MotA/TolQ/ExbB proton channel family protein [Erythrobacter crassostrea]
MATLARCGWSDLLAAAKALVGLWRPKFDETANRSTLARCLQHIDRSGPLVAEVDLPPDPAIAAIVDAYLRSGSRDALHQARRAARTAREVRRAQAVRTFEYAGELAPVFGLVGTLFAITQIAPPEGANVTDATMGAIATAVLSSLYGVLTAHLACIPLGKAIERRSEREQAERDTLFEWFDDQIRPDHPPPARIGKVA